MKHICTFFILFCQIAFANTLLQQASQFEAQGKYKEAMEIYKQLALENLDAQKELETTLQSLDEEKQEKISFKNGLNHIKNSFEQVADKETNSTIEQALSSSFEIYPYKENYFLPISYDLNKRDDRDQNEAKFQISINKPITYNLVGLKETIYFGYTQKSWWQIYSDSSPFRETNYAPEVYMIAPYSNHENSLLKSYKIGFLHESNGQHGQESRSWNRLYLEGYLQYSNLFIVPRVWYRIPEKKSDDDNPDIEDYLGYGDINLIYAMGEHTFKLLFRNNLKLNSHNRGFAQANWIFPLTQAKNTFGFVQLSSGYGDSLIDYDQEINRISFGISLSR